MRIEDYHFKANVCLVLGEARRFGGSARVSEIQSFQPRFLMTNAACPGLVLVDAIRRNGKAVVDVGQVSDAYAWAFTRPRGELAVDVPEILPAHFVEVTGEYTGALPPGYERGDLYIFCVTFQGTAEHSGSPHP